MDTATFIQGVYILFNLYIVSVSFRLIGRQPENTSRYKATGQSAFIHGLFTLAFLIWWDTTDLISLSAKIAAIGLMWLPWIYDLADIHKPAAPLTLKIVTIGTLIQCARIGLVLGFWVLY